MGFENHVGHIYHIKGFKYFSLFALVLYKFLGLLHVLWVKFYRYEAVCRVLACGGEMGLDSAMACLNQSWSYQNQFTGGGFLKASPRNDIAPRTWFTYGWPQLSNHGPQLDASFLGTGSTRNGIGGSQSLNYSPRVDNVHSDVIILNDGGQSREQIATYDLNSIMEGAVQGAYEFDYWITHGHPPSPARASSSMPPLHSGRSLAPRS